MAAPRHRPARRGSARLGRVTSGISRLRPLYIARGQTSAKADNTVHMSSAAKPVNQPDALGLLLDRVRRGGDATLIAEGEAGYVLLDLAADSLSGRRIRVLRAEEVLPSRLAAPAGRVAGPARAGVPEDEVLSRSFQALTVLDQACDRIVLLVGDAHALRRPALRYIQFASRSAPHLQLVFCGTRALLDALNLEEFAWLRARLMAGLVLTLAPPIPEDFDEEPAPSTDPGDPAEWAEEAAAPFPGVQRPAVSASGRSWPLRLGALALLGLVGGAASLMLVPRGGGADRPATIQQALSVVVPPPPPPAMPAPGMPAPVMPAPGVSATGAASQADPGTSTAATPDALSPRPPAMAADAQGAGAGVPSVPVTPPPAGAPGPVAMRPPTASLPESEPPEPPGPARSLGRPSSVAAASRAAAATSASRARRLREAREQAPRDDEWASPQPEFGSWTAPSTQPTRYIGSYTTDANGVRAFRPEP